jgi:hypothetical protein
LPPDDARRPLLIAVAIGRELRRRLGAAFGHTAAPARAARDRQPEDRRQQFRNAFAVTRLLDKPAS